MYDNWEEDHAGWRRRPERDPILYTIISYVIRAVLIAGVLLAIILFGMAFLRAVTNPAAVAVVQTTPAVRATAVTPTLVTLAPTMAAVATPTPIPQPTSTPSLIGKQYRVANTNGDGVLLRPQPSLATSSRIGVIEGGIVTVVDNPVTVDGVLWYKVSDRFGNQGFVRAEYLVPV